ncbi:MAG: hypothetical protein HYV60_20345, partial [Planctomycetia bacterium]|nr:hypothetical protein [Planctomycetia bacterium]
MAGFPPAPFDIRIGTEQLYVTAVNGGTNTLTVLRGVNGTTAAAHADNEIVNVLASYPIAGFSVTDLDEQELFNTHLTLLASTGQATITVADLSQFPTAFPYEIRIDTEELRVTGAASATQLNVLRGRNGTADQDHAVGALVRLLSSGSTSSGAINPGATSIAVDVIGAFPPVGLLPFRIRVDAEDLVVTGISGSTLQLAGSVTGSYPLGTLVQGPRQDELQVKVTVAADGAAVNGGLRAAAVGRAAVMSDGSRVITIQGTEADVNSTLANLRYTVPTPDFNRLNNGGNVIITADVNDFGNTGVAVTPLSDANLADNSMTVSVEPINDRPTINDATFVPTLDEDAPAGLSFATVSLGDVDEPDHAGTKLRVTFVVTNGGLLITANPNAVIQTADSILAATIGKAPDPMNATGTYSTLVVEGTIAGLNTAIGGMKYFNDIHFNTESVPFVESVSIEVNDLGYTDKDSGTVFDINNPERLLVSKTHAITVRPTNDPPLVDASSVATTANPARPPLQVDEDSSNGLAFATIRLFDAEDQFYDPHTIQLQLTLTVVHGGLTITPSGATLDGANSVLATAVGAAPDPMNVTGSYEKVILVGTAAQLETALGTLKYYNDQNFNTEKAANQETLTIDLNDLGNTDYRTAAHINTSVTVSPAQHLVHSQTLTLTVLPTNDAPIVDLTSAVTSTTIIPTPPQLVYDEDNADGLAFTGIRINELPDETFDPGSVEVDVTLTVKHGGVKIDNLYVGLIQAGTSTLATADGIAPDAGIVTGSYEVLTLRGTTAQLHLALDTLEYFNDQDFNTEILPANEETLTIGVNDLGNSDHVTDGDGTNGANTMLGNNPGATTALTGAGTLTITVRPTNDTPVIDISTLATPTANPLPVLHTEEDSAAGMGFTNLIVTEPADQPMDAHNLAMRVTLTVLNGGLTITPSGATLDGINSVLATAVGSVPDPAIVTGSYQTVVLVGTLPQLNTALGTLKYYNDHHFNTEAPGNTEELRVSIVDLGNTDYRTSDYTLPNHINFDPLVATALHRTAVQTLGITVLPFNDAPVLDVSALASTPAAFTIEEDSPAGLQITGIRVSEVPDDQFDPQDLIIDLTVGAD